MQHQLSICCSSKSDAEGLPRIRRQGPCLVIVVKNGCKRRNDALLILWNLAAA
jgi:hypothetical protein